MAIWDTLLKEKQPNVLLPPGFKKAQVLGNNKCVYTITLKKPLTDWGFVNTEGVYKKKASNNDVYSEIEKYPSVNCCFLQKDPSEDNCWIVCTDNNVFKLRFVPDTTELPTPLTTIIAKGLGGVVAFHSFNYRDMQPWNVDAALEVLHSAKLQKKTELSWLRTDQKLAFSILRDGELQNRIPKPEQQIKKIMDAENANLINMRKLKGGYSLEFRYNGTIRRIQINEDLTLRDAGMCLSGWDKDYSLDSFIAVLQYENRRNEFPARYRGEDNEDDNDY